MSLEGYTCDLCGAFVPSGGWPFCKGGHGQGTAHLSTLDYIDKHIDLKPTHITSWRQRDEIMKRRGLAPLADFAPTEDERKYKDWAQETRAKRREKRG